MWIRIFIGGVTFLVLMWIMTYGIIRFFGKRASASCPKCQSSDLRGWKFCPRCGSPKVEELQEIVGPLDDDSGIFDLAESREELR